MSTDVGEIIEMACCYKTSFDDIYYITGLLEQQTINLMRANLKQSSFSLSPKCVSGRKAKENWSY